MSVIYLTWGETPRSYGVFGNQVVQQFVRTCKFAEIREAYFISAVPLVHSGFVREKFGYFRELNKVKSALGTTKFIWIPIYTTQNFVNSNSYTFELMHNFSHYHLAAVLKRINAKVVHCRSYHAAWAAVRVRIRFGLNFKIIFDGRDLWPEEMALKLGFDETSVHYKYLKKIERLLLEKSDYSVSVSQMMHDHYVDLGALRDHCIYLSADVKKLYQKRKRTSRIRSEECINFCYLGALSDSTWHKTIELAKLYSNLIRIFPKCFLTIVTTSDYRNINAVFSKYNINSYCIKTTKTVDDLRDILSHQDFGLMSYFIPENELQKKLGQVLLSSKAVEYLSAGLPMICSGYCGDISRIIIENKLGISYFPESVEKLSVENFLPFLSESARERCQSFALANFDCDVSAGKYAKLYSDAIFE